MKLVDGVYRVPDRGVAKRHRLQVGTIVGDASMQVKYLSGGTIGSIEESFIARLRPGDCFVFAGRVLEYDPATKAVRVVAHGFSFANGLALSQDGSRYFDVHHTVHDTFDRLDPAGLPQNVAAWAATAWLAARANCFSAIAAATDRAAGSRPPAWAPAIRRGPIPCPSQQPSPRPSRSSPRRSV